MARLLLLLAILTASPCRADVPKLFTDKQFTCATLAEAANHYIALGEKAALEQLESLTLDRDADFRHLRKRAFSRNERIGWVCRILFQPRGKEPLRPPAFGAHFLPDRSMPLAKWPLYPVVASGSTHFVLSEGYLLAGEPEQPKDYLRYCRSKGRFRTERVPTPTKRQALKDLEKLRKSGAWKAIKWKDSGPGFSYTYSEEWVWGFIKAQAEKMPDK
jgi:hypothetical protein